MAFSGWLIIFMTFFVNESFKSQTKQKISQGGSTYARNISFYKKIYYF